MAIRPSGNDSSNLGRPIDGIDPKTRPRAVIPTSILSCPTPCHLDRCCKRSRSRGQVSSRARPNRAAARPRRSDTGARDGRRAPHRSSPRRPRRRPERMSFRRCTTGYGQAMVSHPDVSTEATRRTPGRHDGDRVLVRDGKFPGIYASTFRGRLAPSRRFTGPIDVRRERRQHDPARRPTGTSAHSSASTSTRSRWTERWRSSRRALSHDEGARRPLGRATGLRDRRRRG